MPARIVGLAEKEGLKDAPVFMDAVANPDFEPCEAVASQSWRPKA